MPKKSKPYNLLAPVYNHLMRSIDYEAWGEYIALLVKEHSIKNPIVLEIAAGNLILANYLRKNYFRNIIVSDISLEMIKEHKCSAPKICCDMTSLPFRKSFDITLSAFDSVNYLLTKKSFKEMLNQVAMVTKTNGLFLFDVSLEKNSYKYLKMYKKKGSKKGISYTQESSYNNKTCIHRQKFLFDLGNGNKYIETHKQKIYKFEEYFKMVESSQFYIAACYRAFTLTDATPNIERAQFVLKRK